MNRKYRPKHGRMIAICKVSDYIIDSKGNENRGADTIEGREPVEKLICRFYNCSLAVAGGSAALRIFSDAILRFPRFRTCGSILQA